MRAAIIGGGVSGLAAAKRLSSVGIDIAVFDKGRGPGGRMSTRRGQTPIGELRFDHGAQFFTARDPAFRTTVSKLEAAGYVAVWNGSFHLDGAPDPRSDTRYVGTPGMNGVIRGLAADVSSVSWGRRVAVIRGAARAWMLEFEDASQEGPFDIVLVATPAEQTGPLLEDVAPAMAAEARSALSAPCWAAMFAFDKPVDTPFDGARYSAGDIGWMARNASKPGRDAAETWVVHGASDWSKTHLEDMPEEAVAHLQAAFRDLTSAPEPIYAAAHRWRYAQVARAANVPFGWHESSGVGCCGDWRVGPRVEAAWISGDGLGVEVTKSD